MCARSARETESYQFPHVDKGKTEKSTDRSGLCVQAAEYSNQPESQASSVSFED
jgi:hypothetical protein